MEDSKQQTQRAEWHAPEVQSIESIQTNGKMWHKSETTYSPTNPHGPS